MAVGMRPTLGQNLAGIVAGDQRWPMPQPPQMPPQMPQHGMEQKPRSKGQMIAGILGDALLGFGGQQGQFGPLLARERQQHQSDQREEVQWTRRREAGNQDWTQRENYKRTHPDPTSLERNLATYQAWGPEQRKAYGEMQQAERGDPFVTTTLPNRQFYAGPQSGLIAALTGQGGAPAAKPRRLGPVVDLPGGAGTSAPPPFADPLKAPGRMTSGRRTVEGNRLVGGKTNSRHLLGDAADYVGATPAALRAYFGPNVKIIPEGDHNHVQGIGAGRVPYFGRNGTKGR